MEIKNCFLLLFNYKNVFGTKLAKKKKKYTKV